MKKPGGALFRADEEKPGDQSGAGSGIKPASRKSHGALRRKDDDRGDQNGFEGRTGRVVEQVKESEKGGQP